MAWKRGAEIAAGLLAGVACACSGGRPRPEPPAAPTPGVAPDVSYDWHGLVTMPFGSLLKDSPVPLHEVLLFHEGPPVDADNKDCFAMDRPPPRFVGQRPDTYLLCFDHDHMNRIEAVVRLAADDAPEMFARACALWLKQTVSGDAAPAVAAPRGVVCEGRDGNVAFSAKLGLAPGDASGTLTITLVDATPPA